MGTLGGTMAYAHGINSSGTIVGDSTLPGDVLLDAFVYSNGTMTDLNAPGETAKYGAARAINDSGTIVGSSTVIISGYAHAFSYSNGKFTDLGTLGGTMASAVAINSSGTIVGSSSLPGESQTDSFVYSSGQMSDLNNLLVSPSVALSDVEGIGDLGQIAGNGTDQLNGYSGALLLTPISVHLSVVVAGATSLGARHGRDGHGPRFKRQHRDWLWQDRPADQQRRRRRASGRRRAHCRDRNFSSHAEHDWRPDGHRDGRGAQLDHGFGFGDGCAIAGAVLGGADRQSVRPGKRRDRGQRPHRRIRDQWLGHQERAPEGHRADSRP
jgi:probable HAF family extracellular repeat protein